MPTTITLGDSKTLRFPLRNLDTGAPFDPTGCSGIFTCKANAATTEDTGASFQYTTGGGGLSWEQNAAGLWEGVVQVMHVDTKSLKAAVPYPIDIQAMSPAGVVSTVLLDTLTFRRDVTRETSPSVPVHTATPPIFFDAAALISLEAEAQAAKVGAEAAANLAQSAQAGVSASAAEAGDAAVTAAAASVSAAESASSASSSASSASASAGAASTSATQAANSATAADASKTAAAGSATAAANSATAADTSKTAAAASATAADASKTAAASSATSAGTSATNAANSATAAAGSATAAGTSATNAANSATAAATSATNAANSATQAANTLASKADLSGAAFTGPVSADEIVNYARDISVAALALLTPAQSAKLRKKPVTGAYRMDGTLGRVEAWWDGDATAGTWVMRNGVAVTADAEVFMDSCAANGVHLPVPQSGGKLRVIQLPVVGDGQPIDTKFFTSGGVVGVSSSSNMAEPFADLSATGVGSYSGTPAGNTYHNWYHAARIQYVCSAYIPALSDETNQFFAEAGLGFNAQHIGNQSAQLGLFVYDPHNGLGLGINNNNWWAVTVAASFAAATVTDTLMAVATTEATAQRLEVATRSSGARVVFSINNVVVATHTTNLPQNVLSVREGIKKTLGVNTRNLRIKGRSLTILSA